MEYSSNPGFKFDMPKGASSIIKVIGVGGGGNNALKHMYEKGINGVDFIICNTDSQTLDNNPVGNKVQLGVSITEGLGAGADPEVGEKAAIESIDEIKNALGSNTKMAFITAGMGGGTGTGAAPVIAKIAKEMGILTVGIVTVPFTFEGKRRREQADNGLEKMRSNVDSLIVINNDKLRQQFGNLGFKASFSKADEVLTNAAKGMAEVITGYFDINIDFRDAKTVLQNSGTALMSSGTATGENKAEEAVRKALDSPLLNDNKITGAKNVLLLIRSGNEEVTMDEIGSIMDHIQAEAGDTAEIIFGVGTDEELGDAVSVLVIATGFSNEHKMKTGPAGVQKRNLYADEQPQRVFQTEDQTTNSPKYFNLDDSEQESGIDFSTHSVEKQNPNSSPENTLKNDAHDLFTVPSESLSFPVENSPKEPITNSPKADHAQAHAADEDLDAFSLSFDTETPMTPEESSKAQAGKPLEIKFTINESSAQDSGFQVNSKPQAAPSRDDMGSQFPEKPSGFSSAAPVDQPQSFHTGSLPAEERVQVSTPEPIPTMEEEVEFEEFTFKTKKSANPVVNERRNKLQEFNARYDVVDESQHFETVPAFKRKNIQLEDHLGSTQQVTSFLKDEKGVPQIRENRFLNKDVD